MEKNKLKTLKDLRTNKKLLPAAREVRINDLRQEAIKWVKLCKGDLKKTKDKEAIMFLNGEIFAFEHFFNITEEELKTA